MDIVSLLAGSPALLVALLFALGLLVGSFINVVVYRLPIMLEREWRQQCHEFLEIEPQAIDTNPAPRFTTFNLATPDSHCPHCHYKIKPWENIPVLSYLLLGGKCSQCKSRISLRYPAVELASGILAGLVAYQFGATWLMTAMLVLAWSLLALTLIDFDHQLLPDNITLPLLWLGLLVNAIDLGLGITLRDALLGAIAGYLSLWAFYWLFKLLTGKEGMGYGDFKLLAALGAWLGWQSLLPVIILSSAVGAVFGIAAILVTGRDRSVPMPFGPFLAGAGLVMSLWGPQINALYFNLFVS